jgi:hypothetical protein
MTENTPPPDEQASSEQRNDAVASFDGHSATIPQPINKVPVIFPDQEEPKLAIREDRPLIRFRHRRQDSDTELDVREVNWPAAAFLIAAAILVCAILWALAK